MCSLIHRVCRVLGVLYGFRLVLWDFIGVGMSLALLVYWKWVINGLCGIVVEEFGGYLLYFMVLFLGDV